MKRKEYPGIHSGQISFPGGKRENFDPDLMETALRESREELGLQVSTDQVIGNLSELYIVASHFNILPVVAVMPGPPDFKPDPREVDQIIIASVDQLLHPRTRKEKDILVRGYDIRAPYFDIDSQVVWGATAMILNEFLVLVRELVPE
jgi:8-oxo-dGTP pyrophosphatase MutT (NUDIX family)